MNKQNDLAIVIPAYKSTFLAAALDSIAAQTCQDFTLYIGDDGSPSNLEQIVDRYRDRINLVYRRFDTNLGGKDLVAQWERCIDMTQGEEWLWLFSDDDVMEAGCVEAFYKSLGVYPEAGLLHFDVLCLDEETGLVRSLQKFPKVCDTRYYLDKKIKGHLLSFVVEFVVRRDIYFDNGRFQNFDLAWGSDFISWVKFSAATGGIVTCDTAKVIWRKSSENISPNKSNHILVRKIRALIDNAKWLSDFASSQGYADKWFYTKYALGEIRRNRRLLSKSQRKDLLEEYCRKIHPSFGARCVVWGLKHLI